MSRGTAAKVRADRFDVQSADGTPITVWSAGAGPPLVLVHGSLSDHTTFDTLVDQLRDSITCFSIDRGNRPDRQRRHPQRPDGPP
jgi:pimeloyl-ACP methyl ester carboxylesterase